jgi:tetratricopeptide (TPR) repeat protein
METRGRSLALLATAAVAGRLAPAPVFAHHASERFGRSARREVVMGSRVVCCLLFFMLSTMAAAQNVAEGLAAAKAKMAAKEWPAALELLMPLRDLADGDERQQVANALARTANGLEWANAAAAALPAREAVLFLQRRRHGEADHADVATALDQLASCLQGGLSDFHAARPHLEAAFAMWQRLLPDQDDERTAQAEGNLAACLLDLGLAQPALEHNERTLAMRRRLFGDADHPAVMQALNNRAACLRRLGRVDEAMQQFEELLAMLERAHESSEHEAVTISNIATCLEQRGEPDAALAKWQTVLEMRRSLAGNRDQPDVAMAMNNLAMCLRQLGRLDQALANSEAALAMWLRCFGDRDRVYVAMGRNNVAYCLEWLGQPDKALPLFEAALAMHRRIQGEGDNEHIATGMNNVAHCLAATGAAERALPIYQQVLAMQRRMFGDRDHPEIAEALHNLGVCHEDVGQLAEALVQLEAALAMWHRLCPDRDHPAVAKATSNLATCREKMRQHDVALAGHQVALAMWRRLYGDQDHPHVAASFHTVATCQHELGQNAEALATCELACAMIERIRDQTRTAAELRQALFDDLKRGGIFERLQAIAVALGRPDLSLQAAERSRSRELLDLLEQQRFDPLEEAERRAKGRGDGESTAALAALREQLRAASLENDKVLQELARLDGAAGDRDARRQELLARAKANATRSRQLLDERARRLGDVLPVGRTRSAAEIQAALAASEVLLEFTLTKPVSILHVVSREGTEAFPLPTGWATITRVLDPLLRQYARTQLPARGREPDGGGPGADAASAMGRELFASLIPAAVWLRLQACQRVFVAPHRELHRLPFELLVTGTADGKPVYWLDAGPPVAAVPSGSALCWLRRRAADAADDATGLDLLAVGDPAALDGAAGVPESGVLVTSVNADGPGAKAGLQPGDVLTSYDRHALQDDKSLRDERMVAERAIEDGQRDKSPIPLGVWRHGSMLEVTVAPGLLGVQVAPGRARAASRASLDPAAQAEQVTRQGDLERLGKLPPLRGARAEAEAVAALFAAKGARVRSLLGAEATEPAVFAGAQLAKYLHFACHGIAEEYAGQSLSMLVLSQPERVLPGDDGLLKLSDLLHEWRGRLSSCRLVVLSACSTNVGPTMRDDAPHALPLGFLFAGAPSVVSSLWTVVDASTRELMVAFYERLLAGERDRLRAFTEARKQLRRAHPDPYHWAPFLFMGSPR